MLIKPKKLNNIKYSIRNNLVITFYDNIDKS